MGFPPRPNEVAAVFLLTSFSLAAVDQAASADDTHPMPTSIESGSKLLDGATRTLKAEKCLLFFPVKTDAPKRHVRVLVDGVEQRYFEIELADTEPGWWAPLDIGQWAGHELTVYVDHLPESSRALEQLTQSDTLLGGETLYHESLRAQLHFSAMRGWINDPNGMVHGQGEYHLYYQYNPYGWHWGNMHWGHAVSRDLVHWEERPISLYPHARGDDVFSGSAVVDHDNTSGWRTGADDLLVGAYTSTKRGECMIYSNDRGRSWKEYEGNPVIRHTGATRLLWHAPTHEWVIVVYAEDQTREKKEEIQGFSFYTSPDLKKWTYQSRVAGFFECPDLFELPVEGSMPPVSKWVLSEADSRYMVGNFDGKNLVPETPKLQGHYGQGFYAAQTFSNDPRGRIVQIGWLKTPTPGMPFNGTMSLPHSFALRQTSEGPRLVWTPVEELTQLRAKTLVSGLMTVTPDASNPLAGVSGELLEVRATFSQGDAHEISFHVRGVPITYDADKQELNANGFRAAAPWRDGKMSLTIYADRTGLEIFANDGLRYIPIPLNFHPEIRNADLRVNGGKVVFDALEVYELGSIWK